MRKRKVFKITLSPFYALGRNAPREAGTRIGYYNEGTGRFRQTIVAPAPVAPARAASLIDWNAERRAVRAEWQAAADRIGKALHKAHPTRRISKSEVAADVAKQRRKNENAGYIRRCIKETW